jgi:hypothetical protein
MEYSSKKDPAHLSALCLAGLVGEDGQFRYRYDARTGENLSGYNILRHSGAIWALVDTYRDTGDVRLLNAAQRALRYLLDNSLRFYRSYRNVCICEDNTIKLGGSALAALTMLAMFSITRERLLLTLSEQLCQFILDQRQEQGELVHKRYFESGKISSFRSMYYTGEALFAMVTLFEQTGERHWLDAAVNIEKPLADEGYGVAEQSHWMLYALEMMTRFSPSPDYSRHAVAIVEHILDHPDYLQWQRSTPIACRSEGLLAFLRQPPTGNQQDDHLRQRCRQQVENNISQQMSFCLDNGAFIRGGNDHRHHEIRIDYLQHNISSLLHYSRLESSLQPP